MSLWDQLRLLALEEGIELSDEWSGLDELLPLWEIDSEEGSVVVLWQRDGDSMLTLQIVRQEPHLAILLESDSLENIVAEGFVQYLSNPRPPRVPRIYGREPKSTRSFEDWWPKIQGKGFLVKIDGERNQLGKRYTFVLDDPEPSRRDHSTLADAVDAVMNQRRREE